MNPTCRVATVRARTIATTLDKKDLDLLKRVALGAPFLRHDLRWPE
jgi:hypothetical protein